MESLNDLLAKADSLVPMLHRFKTELDEAFEKGDLFLVAARASLIADIAAQLSATCLQITIERAKS